jgi:hypothetical protein|tara:strand:+ start:220 stop:558 length:339 start_codon:yes stop_codon:yes gene_type:complete
MDMTMKLLLHTLLISALSLAMMTGCGRVNRSTYDTDCNTDDECIVISKARDCNCSDLEAINISDQERAQRDNDRVNRRSFCPLGTVNCDVAALEAYCNMGTCDLRPLDFEQE